LKIALGVAKALRYLHHECAKQKIAHGNIKSSNILLDENYHPLVADFGLALIMNNPTAATSRVAGYRAPEHAGSKRISQAADVYSFGVVWLLRIFFLVIFGDGFL
jgi:serine/threonine protein kinase